MIPIYHERCRTRLQLRGRKMRNNWIRLVTDNGSGCRWNVIKKIYKLDIWPRLGTKVLMKMDLVQKHLISVIIAATAVILRFFNLNLFVCTSWRLVPRHTFCRQLNYSKLTGINLNVSFFLEKQYPILVFFKPFFKNIFFV